MTAYLRAPGHGARQAGEDTAHDDVIMVEVMCEHLGRSGWAECRRALEKELRQDEIVGRALPMDALLMAADGSMHGRTPLRARSAS